MNLLSNKEIIRLYEEKQKFAHYCKNCGHTVYIANKTGKAICSHCHNYVFKDAKTEFEYRMKEKLINEKRRNK